MSRAADDAADEAADDPVESRADGSVQRSGRPAQPTRKRDDDPVLPSVSRDETDIGWGDEPGRRDADWYRRERPPHHE